MNLNVTYHWTHLEYSYPSFKHEDTWGPVARMTIMARIEAPFVKEERVWGTYDVLKCLIEGNAGDPCDQIINFIQKYADSKGIEIQFDFLERWNGTEGHTTVCDWEEF